MRQRYLAVSKSKFSSLASLLLSSAMVLPMSQPRRHHIHAHVYTNKWHLLATIGFVITPFLFLLFFAPFARIAFSVLIWDVLFSSWRLAVAYVIALILAWIVGVGFERGVASVIALPPVDLLKRFPTFASLPV